MSSSNLVLKSAPTAKIIGIQFGMLSPEEIEKSSVANIHVRDMYVSNKPVINSLADIRMGVQDPGIICPTDNLDYVNTPGYHGHINLAVPVFYIQYLKDVQKWTHCVCCECSKLLISKTQYEKLLAPLTSQQRWKKVVQLCKKVKRCGGASHDGCGALQPTKISKEGVATIVAEWSITTGTGENKEIKKQAIKWTAEILYKKFKLISDDDVNYAGFNSVFSRPEWMICKTFLVPPPAIRPSVKHDAQQRSEDDLTHILLNIIRTNNELIQDMQKNSSANIIDQHVSILQYFIANIVNNNVPGMNAVTNRSGRPFKSIISRLNGKGGRMRGNLMAKRVDFSARSVITGEPNLSIMELGIPMPVAMNLTKPEVVNERNREFLTRLVRNGPDIYPGAKILKRKGSSNAVTLRYMERDNIILEDGDIIDRHLMDGDMVLFNRQPTLHRMSMQSFYARIMSQGNTFRFNVAVAAPFNADFDGDEMNMHVPQNVLAEVELRELSAVPYQIISPSTHGPIIGLVQDNLLGAYLFTNEGIRFTPQQAMNLLMTNSMINVDKLGEIIRNKKHVTNFDLLSQIMPPISLKYKTKGFNDETEDAKTSNNVLEIRNGEYIRGRIDKGVITGGSKSIIQRITNDYSNKQCARFIDNLQNIITEFMKMHSFSVGISDLISNAQTTRDIVKIIDGKRTEVKDIIDQVMMGTFINNTGRTTEDEFEGQVLTILSQASGDAGKTALKSLDPQNRFVTLVKAGSKGNENNIAFMTSCLGQQTVEGKRIPCGFNDRTLPHFPKYDESPAARGFVVNSYVTGLSPTDLFFHAMAGRVGLIDTAVKTSSTGYIQRRLIKGLEDAMVHYDHTVRSNKGIIIQYRYGEDSIDTIRVETQTLPLVTMSIQDIYAHYNFPDIGDKIASKTLSAVFIKQAFAAFKKEADATVKKCQEYTQQAIKYRDAIVRNVFGYRDDTGVNCPVAFQYIIGNIQGQANINQYSLVDITPLEVFKLLEQTIADLNTLRTAQPTELFKALYYFYLSPKDLLLIKRFNRAAIHRLLDTVKLVYKQAIVAPGEMVGPVAAQSIGQVSTQMSLAYGEKMKIIAVNKHTAAVSIQSTAIGDFCDKLIAANAAQTQNTGHVDSVETCLAHLDMDYFIVGVDAVEKTHWNRISHVSRHPVNGQMMRVTTKSGRTVETTTSHSHLVRSEATQTVVPIVGANMKEGMRIPVATHIDNPYVVETVLIGSETYKLDHRLGWFIGAYLAEGNLNGSSICITNIAPHYIKQVAQVAELFGAVSKVKEQKGEYGPSVTSTFRHKELSGFIASACGNGSFVKHVPDFAFIAPNEFKAGLFQGYFDGDGNVQSDANHRQLRACSRSKQLIYDLALLLNYFDIFACIKETAHKDVPLYHLNIPSKFAQKYKSAIGSILHEEALDNIALFNNRANAASVKEYIDKINGLGPVIAACGKKLALPNHSGVYAVYARKQNHDIPRITLEKYYNIFKTHANAAIIEPELRILQQALTAGVFWDEVVKIEVYTPTDNNYVYDFTVPGNQTFMTESSVIVHNTLNSFTYETPILVRNRTGIITEVPLGKFTEEFIEKATRKEYYEDKDTTYAELDEYYEVPSCGENGEITWEHIEAVTRHPVINTDGTNTMLRVTTDEEREVVATKAKSFLKLVDGKVIGVNGSDLKVGDYLPVSMLPLEYTPQHELDLRELLPPTEYTYSSELEKAYEYCKAARKTQGRGHTWWKRGNGVIFTLPYGNRGNDAITAQMLKLERGEIKPFAPNCVYMANSRSKDDGNRPAIPEKIPLDYHFGYLLGAYAAEGCMTKYQISIANNDTEFYKPIIELCERWNLTTKQYCNENKIQEGWTSSDIRIYNKVLCRILEPLCGKLSHNKFVLDKIIYSNRECILGFLDAYISGDGSVNAKSKTISAGSVSKNLLEAVQKMLNTLGVYSFIKKSVKRTTTNRGTLPENIHQPYVLYVTNEQAQQLAKVLNPSINYKRDNIKAILEHTYKYKVGHKHETIPNEIDGVIVHQPRPAGKFTQLLFNRIKSIEEVPNTTAYAYDLTVANTRNFNIANSLAGADTFHSIGILSKTNATRGVPRIEEILSLSENIKNPSLTVYLKPEDRTLKNKAQEIMYRLEHTTLGELVKTTAVYFDPDDLNTLIHEDRELLAQYKEYETMMDDCATVNLANNNVTKSKWILRMEMDPEVMLEKNITMDDIHFTLNNIYKSQITCVYSDYNADKLVFRVRMNEVLKQNASKTAVNKKPLNQYDQIYVLKNFQDNLMQNVVIRGIKNIRKVAMRKVKNMVIEHNGAYITQDQWVLDTTGTNLLETLSLNYIDKYKTISNDIIEVYNVLGMEAARQTIYNEFVDVIKFDGTYIDYHHFCLLCDRMCYSNNLISIYRHGIKSDNIGPIAKASFEETPEMFLNAAKHGELDIMTGVSANVMCGQEGLYGTNSFEVLLDMNEMSKLSATAEYKKIDKAKELEELFQAGKLAADADACSIKNLSIQNGVVNIGSTDMGTQNDDYNPF